MGQLVTTIGGAFLGGLVGGPFGAQIGALIGGAVGSALFGPTTQGPRLDDLSVSTSTYGNVIPRLFGTSRMATNLIWTTGIKEHKKKSGGLGKGGPKTVSYSYTASFAIAVCAGPIDGILRVWGDTKLIFGASESTAVTPVPPGSDGYDGYVEWLTSSKKKAKYKFRVYSGSEEQLPDALIEADKGAGNVPGYRGLCYLVFEDIPLEDFGNRIPSISVEVSKAQSSQLPQIEFTSNDGSVLQGPGGYYDWENDRYVVPNSGGHTLVYSLRTMAQIGTYTTMDGGRLSGSVGGGPWVGKIGASNSTPVGTYDGTTFEKTAQYGRISNGLGEAANNECLGGFPETSAFVNNGVLGTFRVKSGSGTRYFFVNLNGFGGGSVWGFDGIFINYITRTGTYLSLGEFDGYSQFMIYGWSGGTAFADIYTIQAAAGATQVSFEDDTCTSHLRTVVTPDTAGFAVNTVNYTFDGTFTNISGVTALYIPTDDTILWTGQDNGPTTPFMSKVTTAGDILFTHHLAHTPLALGNSRLIGNTLGFYDNPSDNIVYVDIASGAETLVPFNVFNGGGATWDEVTSSLFFGWIGGGRNNYKRVVQQVAAGTVTVGSICAEIIDETGLLGPADYDVSTLTQEVTGYVISRDATARDCLQQLSSAFFFDGVESDYKIKMVLRGGATKITITEDEMGNVSERDTQLNETLAQEIEAPMRITVSYADRARDYQTGTQSAKRITNPFPSMNSKKEDKTDFPIVMLATDAKQIADKMLKMAWANRVSSEMLLPWKFMKYDPTDVLTISLNDGSSRNVRIGNISMGDDMTMNITGVNESAVAYTSVAVGDPGGGVPQVSATDPGTPLLHVLNTPLLRDIDDTQGVGSNMYMSASTPSGTFGGAYILRALPGSDYVDDGFIGTRPVSGVSLTTLPTTQQWGAIDHDQVIFVSLYSATETLESISYADLMSGKNLAIIGQEVIQFQNAELQADKSWKLTDILRARRGTDYALGSHKPGETFILMAEDGSIILDQRASLDFNYNESLKAVAPGTTADSITGNAYTLNPNDLRPYAPNAFEVTDDGTDVTITFQRRSRITFGLVDGSPDAPYREGTQTAGLFVWTLWAGFTASDRPWENGANVPTTMGSFQVSPDGITFPTPTITTPISETTPEFIVSVYQRGFVDGFPRYIHAKQSGGGWDLTELFA